MAAVEKGRQGRESGRAHHDRPWSTEDEEDDDDDEYDDGAADGEVDNEDDAPSKRWKTDNYPR